MYIPFAVPGLRDAPLAEPTTEERFKARTKQLAFRPAARPQPACRRSLKKKRTRRFPGWNPSPDPVLFAAADVTDLRREGDETVAVTGASIRARRHATDSALQSRIQDRNSKVEDAGTR
jgi:hypothetical protein